MTTADLDQLKRAQEGDRQAMDALLRAHEESVYRFGLRMCGNEDAAKEVLQRTLLTAFERIDQFRGDARLSSWLYALARSHCSRLHRRDRSAPLHDVPLDVPAQAPQLPAERDPSQELMQAEMAQLVATAISLLPERQREAVVLKDVEDLSLDDASSVVGLDLPAFKSRLHRAREQLKLNLAALLQEQPASGLTACPELQRALATARASSVDQAVCRAIEDHLKECTSCRDRMGPLQDAASLCRRLPGGQVPEPVQRAVRTALQNAVGEG